MARGIGIVFDGRSVIDSGLIMLGRAVRARSIESLENDLERKNDER